MKFKFNVGDKVRVLDGSKIEDYAGGWCMKEVVYKEAIITNHFISTPKKLPSYNLKFYDRDFKRYDSYTFDERGLELTPISIQCLIVGRKVFLCMRNSDDKIITSEARCHPDDEFDLKTGMNIALDRLLEKTSLYNGKVVCVENNGHMRFGFTKGKIYTIANGEIEDDYGMRPFRKIKSLDDFDEIEGLHFIPLVE